MSACIIPVAPDFQDPTGAPNYAPYIKTFSPDFGSVVSIVTSLSFEVQVIDLNADDDLYFRWVADYPAYTASTRRISEDVQPNSTDGTAVTDSVTIDCSYNLVMTADSKHQLEVIVADRPFVSDTSSNTLDLVQPPGFAVRGDWTFEITCQSPPPP
jgi:hypothetical protein